MESPGLYLSSLGFKGIWFGSGKKQIEQPKKYMKFIIENSYLKYLIKELLKERVEFLTGGELTLLNLTELNARSPRADFVIYDEESQADRDAYNAAVNILAGSNLALVVHISTPTKGSVFEENHDRLKMREIVHNEQFIFSRTWEDASWLYQKKDWYEEQKRILYSSGRDWYFRQEHEASFELPMGAVLQNVIYDPYPDWLLDQVKEQPLLSGLDWNPVSGHWIVSIKWTGDMMNCVVIAEHDIGIGHAVELTQQQYINIQKTMIRGNKLVIEDGGFNEEYVKWFKKKNDKNPHYEQTVKYEEWDSAGIAKLKAVSYLIQNGITVYVDKLRFPTLAKQIEDLHWDANATEPKLFKDPANSPHALDGFLHAISEKNRLDGVIEISRFY